MENHFFSPTSPYKLHQRYTFFHIRTSFKTVLPAFSPEFKTLTPKHRNWVKILSLTSQYFVNALCGKPVLDLSSHKTVQVPDLPHTSSLEPTNCHMVGASLGQQSWRPRNEMRPGMKVPLAGNSYQTMDGKISPLLCQPLAWPWINALSAVHAGRSEVAWAEPPTSATSLSEGTVKGRNNGVLQTSFSRLLGG